MYKALYSGPWSDALPHLSAMDRINSVSTNNETNFCSQKTFFLKTARKARSFAIYGERDSMLWKANSLSQSVKYLNNWRATLSRSQNAAVKMTQKWQINRLLSRCQGEKEIEPQIHPKLAYLSVRELLNNCQISRGYW